MGMHATTTHKDRDHANPHTRTVNVHVQVSRLCPEAKIIAHPECEPQILQHADHIGSTTALLRYAVESDHDEFIVVTEAGILHQMEKAAPNKKFYAAPPMGNCACNECPYMRRNTLEKLYLALRDLTPQIDVPEPTRAAALKPIQRMLNKAL